MAAKGYCYRLDLTYRVLLSFCTEAAVHSTNQRGSETQTQYILCSPLGVISMRKKWLVTRHLALLLLFFFFGINQNGATPLDLAVGETCRAKLKIRANSFASCVTRPDSIMRRAVDSCAACAHDGSSADAVAQSPLDRKIARSFL